MPDPKAPGPAQLPTAAQLVKSTLLAIVAAAAILVVVVLPAEYAIDPTGLGEALGLNRMGEIKQQLSEEAAADVVVEVPTPTERPAAPAADGWQDERTLTLAPDAAVELKLVMQEDARAEYEWEARGGALNFNVHGDGGGQSVEYDKGRGAEEGSGEIVAAFDGYHGWFWRNRSGGSVELVLRVRGEYGELKQVR